MLPSCLPDPRDKHIHRSRSQHHKEVLRTVTVCVLCTRDFPDEEATIEVQHRFCPQDHSGDRVNQMHSDKSVLALYMEHNGNTNNQGNNLPRALEEGFGIN